MSLVFISPDPSKALGLENLIDDLYVICAFEHQVLKYLREKGVNVLCYSEKKIDLRNTGRLFEQEEVLEYLKNLKEKKGEVKILVFKSSKRIFKIAEENGFEVLMSDPDLCRDIENKTKFFDFLKNKNVKIPKYRIDILKNLDYVGLKNEFGTRFVIQFGRGFGGNSTYFINSEKDFENVKIKQDEFPVKIMEFIEGITLTVNCCVSRQDIYVSRPFVQITGEPLLNKFQGGTCGVSFSAIKNLDPEILESVETQSRVIGEILREKGYKGIFGLDFVVETHCNASLPQSRIFIIECNPRMPISVPHFCKRQEALGEKPLILEHLEAFEGKRTSSFAEATADKKDKDIKGATLILRNVFGQNLKLKKSFKPVWHVYDFKQDKIFETDLGISFEKIPDILNNQIAFLPICEEKGFLAHPDIAFCDLHFKEDVLDEKFKLKKEVMRLVKRVEGIIMNYEL